MSKTPLFFWTYGFCGSFTMIHGQLVQVYALETEMMVVPFLISLAIKVVFGLEVSLHQVNLQAR